MISRQRTSHVLIYSLVLLLLVNVFTIYPAAEASTARRDFIAANGIVTSAHPLASQAGLAVLKDGGNAFDAAIATAFMLGVVEPHATGIGGGGMAILYVAKENKSYVIDFQDVGPGKARHDTYKRINGKIPLFKRVGYKSVAVPGEVRGMELLHQKFGTKKWKDLLAPAIKTAGEGYEVSQTLSEIITGSMSYADAVSADSWDLFSQYFFKDGMPLLPGDRYVNKELAATLRKIAKGGADVFYKGEIADAIAREFAKPDAEAWITKQDLVDYKAVIREPLQTTYRGHTIYTLPSPGSGVTVAQMLNILEGYPVAKMGFGSEAFKHTFIETQKLAYAAHSKYTGDTDFVNVPVKGLLSKEFANEQRKLINPQRAQDRVRDFGDPAQYESGSTTSFAVADKDGNIISVTKTIGHFMGSAIVVDGTGILMNDHMDTFYASPSSPNAPGPKKRVFSSIASSIVVKDGKPLLAVGSPGASRIISTVAEILVNVIDYKKDIQSAIDAPRVHSRNSQTVQIEADTSLNVRKTLESKGHKLQVLKKHDLFFGGAQGIMYLPDGRMHGAADPRRDGIALGY